MTQLIDAKVILQQSSNVVRYTHLVTFIVAEGVATGGAGFATILNMQDQHRTQVVINSADIRYVLKDRAVNIRKELVSAGIDMDEYDKTMYAELAQRFPYLDEEPV